MTGTTAPPPDSRGKLGLAKIRHGLRTPINHIIGYAEILREETADSLPAAFVTDLEKIHSSGYILLALINRHLGEDCTPNAEPDLHALSHELRTPVNHIIGYGELLAEQCDELGRPDLKPDLARIVSAAHTWLEMMEEHFGKHTNPPAEPPSNPPPPAATPPVLREHWVSIPPTEAPSRGPCTGHLLLADDDEPNRDLLRRRLEKLGYRITTCGDGLEALALVRDTLPDLVLLDMLMPGLNGDEVLVRIKSDETLSHVPVIMISALDQVEGIAHCIELGAEDYLAKPFNPIVLRARIGAVLEKKRLRDIEQVYLKQIDGERARSDRLLLNILPQPIADRLKKGEGHIVNTFDEVTVMFADLAGFTALSTAMPPTQLVRLLDRIFSAFDELADRHGLEKIKTIGDAYMAAAGLPFPHQDHAAAAARMAQDMHRTIDRIGAQCATGLKMRIGICTGPVIAGTIGQKKFIYDLWGDTVNTASRMESHGLPGRTQVAASTYGLLRGRFEFEERGTIDIRGKGPMKAYLLLSS
ncbi:adenylate/guanylate cyclase domain-containing protein [Methylococcus sp. ANG]|uniref:adenylate/guanylate cyclase domain-containing protein n=1 Tax=Methylococcus sp. ANG TaxID=3231903 RepID=UPI0034599942